MNQKVPANTAQNSNYADWQQGDFVLGAQDFIYKYDIKAPATTVSVAQEEDRKREGEDSEPIVIEEVKGLVVVSQTCDIVREIKKRPFVEVSPLVEVKPDQYGNIKAGRMPRFAAIEALEAQNLVVDLDRTMTVEKPILESWKKSDGFTSYDSRRKFSEALGRKRARPAFPDDFVSFIDPLREIVVKKHGKDTDEGKALVLIDEIRVIPEPDWSVEQIKINFLFFLNKKKPDTDMLKIDGFVKSWLNKLDLKHQKYNIDYRLDYLSNYSAEDYVLSERLDYDYLSE